MFLCKVSNKNPMFPALTTEEKFVYLLASKDTQILTWLGKFLYHSLISEINITHNYKRLCMRSAMPGAGVAGGDGCIYHPCPCRLPPVRHSSYIVCRWTCTRLCTRMFMRIIVQTFASSNNVTVTKTRQDISQIRGTSIFLRTEGKGLPPGLHHRRCGCLGLSLSTALRACCGGGAVTVAAFRYNMCAYVLYHIRF